MPSEKRAALATVTVSDSKRRPVLPQFRMTTEDVPMPAEDFNVQADSTGVVDTRA